VRGPSFYAKIYDLEMLEEEIQNDWLNMTRYFILKKYRF